MSADMSRPGPASPTPPGPKISRYHATDHPGQYRPDDTSGTERTEELDLPGDLAATLILDTPRPRLARRRRLELPRQCAARARRREALAAAVTRRTERQGPRR